ncbi:hypothetical protein Ancab_000414 [Ancistrocladus abbreviatus]
MRRVGIMLGGFDLSSCSNCSKVVSSYSRGVKRTANAGDMLPQLSGSNATRISMLSDDIFSEEELKDLHQRVKDGLVKQPTVGELEEKARALHEDMTKKHICIPDSTNS